MLIVFVVMVLVIVASAFAVLIVFVVMVLVIVASALAMIIVFVMMLVMMLMMVLVTAALTVFVIMVVMSTMMSTAFGTYLFVVKQLELCLKSIHALDRRKQSLAVKLVPIGCNNNSVFVMLTKQTYALLELMIT